MKDETAYIARAAAALGDKHATAPAPTPKPDHGKD